MDSRELGKRIKELRLSKRMTQSEVVGDFITRNMLSQIESGTALPSINTLEYIAGKLGVPVASLVSPEDLAWYEGKPGPSPSGLAAELLRAKEHYHFGRFEQVICLMEPHLSDDDPLYDEACALSAHSHLALAKKKKELGNQDAAAGHAKAVIRLSQNGIYSSRELKMEAFLMLDEKIQ